MKNAEKGRQYRVLFRSPLPLRVPRLDVTVWTTCGSFPRQGQGEDDHPKGWPGMTGQPLAPSAARNSIRYQRPPTTPQHSPETNATSASELPDPRSSELCGEEFGRHLSRSHASAILQSGCRPLRCPTSWLWIEAGPPRREPVRMGRTPGTHRFPEKTSLQQKRSVTCQRDSSLGSHTKLPR